MNTDARGVQRGGCTMCGCAGYDGGSEGKKCTDCNHPPAKHVNLSSSQNLGSIFSPVDSIYSSSGDNVTASLFMTSLQGPKCQYPGCSQEAHFDMNSRQQFQVCQAHEGMPVQGPPVPMDQTNDFSSPQPPPTQPPPPRQQTRYGFLQSFFTPHRRVEDQSYDQSGNDTMMPPPQYSPQFHPSQSLPSLTPPPAQQPATPSVPPDQQCKVRGCTMRKHTEPNGRVHDFCGRTHAREYEQQTSKVPAELQCKTPGCFKQRFKSDAGTYFDYCSRYCRNNGIKSPTASASTPNMDLTANGRCSLPGCTAAKYRDPANGRVHDFCGRTHAHLAQMQGITVGAVNINIRRATQEELTAIKGKFQQKWASGKGACPAVSFVFIVTNQKLTQRWQAYRSKLQKSDVEEYYHGTRITCNITTVTTLCNDEECGVCGISRIGLDRRCIQKNIAFQRFGHGFYLAPNTSKCHDYTQGRHGYRAMILFEVCPGNKHVVKKTDPSFKRPPRGFDSVYGQTGDSLNYEELVVYNPDAALPKYIIVYQRDGEAKIAK